MELHGVERYVGVHSVMAQDIVRLLYKTTYASWFMNHECFPKDDCLLCECCIVWQQLATNLVEYVCPEDLAHQPDVRVLFFPLFHYIFIGILRIFHLSTASIGRN